MPTMPNRADRPSPFTSPLAKRLASSLHVSLLQAAPDRLALPHSPTPGHIDLPRLAKPAPARLASTLHTYPRQRRARSTCLDAPRQHPLLDLPRRDLSTPAARPPNPRPRGPTQTVPIRHFLGLAPVLTVRLDRPGHSRTPSHQCLPTCQTTPVRDPPSQTAPTGPSRTHQTSAHRLACAAQAVPSRPPTFHAKRPTLLSLASTAQARSGRRHSPRQANFTSGLANSFDRTRLITAFLDKPDRLSIAEPCLPAQIDYPCRAFPARTTIHCVPDQPCSTCPSISMPPTRYPIDDPSLRKPIQPISRLLVEPAIINRQAKTRPVEPRPAAPALPTSLPWPWRFEPARRPIPGQAAPRRAKACLPAPVPPSSTLRQAAVYRLMSSPSEPQRPRQAATSRLMSSRASPRRSPPPRHSDKPTQAGTGQLSVPSLSTFQYAPDQATSPPFFATDLHTPPHVIRCATYRTTPTPPCATCRSDTCHDETPRALRHG